MTTKTVPTDRPRRTPPPGAIAPIAPLLLTRREAAALLGMSPTRLDRLRAAGLVPGPRIHQGSPGGRGKALFVRWYRAELEAWVAAGMPVDHWDWQPDPNARPRKRRTRTPGAL